MGMEALHYMKRQPLLLSLSVILLLALAFTAPQGLGVFAQTSTPEPATSTPLPATSTPAPATPTPGSPPNTCNGQTATIFETVGTGHDGLIQGTQGADVIKVVIADPNADVTIVGLKGDDLICATGNSRKVVINGNHGADICQYSGASQQQSHLHCETVLP
jgi:hypothetical protein